MKTPQKHIFVFSVPRSEVQTSCDVLEGDGGNPQKMDPEAEMLLYNTGRKIEVDGVGTRSFVFPFMYCTTGHHPVEIQVTDHTRKPTKTFADRRLFLERF